MHEIPEPEEALYPPVENGLFIPAFASLVCPIIHRKDEKEELSSRQRDPLHFKMGSTPLGFGASFPCHDNPLITLYRPGPESLAFLLQKNAGADRALPSDPLRKAGDPTRGPLSIGPSSCPAVGPDAALGHHGEGL